MIKGVNRQIVEVTVTKNAYFERALLVVRPSCENWEEKRLKSEADRFVASLGSYSGLAKKRRRGWWIRVGFAVVGGLIGGLMVFLCR